MSIERIDYKCDRCGVQTTTFTGDGNFGIIESKCYHCMACGLVLRATFVEKEEVVA